MMLTKATVFVWLLYLALFCDVNGNASNKASLSADQINWNLLLKHMGNATRRSSNAKLNVFSKILLANIRARTKFGRADDNIYLTQGDIKLTAKPKDKSKLTASGNKGRKKRALTSDKKILWQSPIYYDFHPNLKSDARTAIASAIKEWEGVLPCIKWIKGKTYTSHQGYLYFFPGDGCYSSVGIDGDNEQRISIGDGCEDHGTVVHEIAHALGIEHEQSRPDRDTYVDIKWGNIIPSMKYNFEKLDKSEVNSYGLPYDFDSVMHYGPYDFAKQDGLKTMISRIPGKIFGDKPKLSKIDVKQARLLYKCTTATATSQTTSQPPSPPPPTTQPPSPPPPTTTSPAGSGSGSGASG